MTQRTELGRTWDRVFGAGYRCDLRSSHRHRRASCVVIGPAIVSILLCSVGCSSSQPPQSFSAATDEATRTAWFRDATNESGISFLHHVGDPTQYELPQQMGSGAALIDFDNDGSLDLYLVDYAGRDVLYRQLRPLMYADLTVPARLDGGARGMGTALGDMNNDGFTDLLVTSYGSTNLWINNGDGTFDDVSGEAAFNISGFATAAAACDYDCDGHLDLFVVNYVDYLPGRWCEDGRGVRDFCGPQAFEGTVDRLFHNSGQAAQSGIQFEDRTIACGLAGNPGKGLGIVCGDLTGDLLVDFFVANDNESNHFWQQQPDGTFLEIGGVNGTAFNQFGEAEASMGVVAADLEGNGSLQLFCTHLGGQTNTVYGSSGGGLYADQTPSTGLGIASLPYTGFGIGVLDPDLNGTLDLLVANGRVRRGTSPAGEDVGEFFQSYAEPNQFFLNSGSLRFREATPEAGVFAQQVEVSRSIAVGDIDNDGDSDFVVSNCAGRSRLFLVEAPERGHWLSLRLIGRHSDRSAIGADVTVILNDRRLMRRVLPCSGYLASHDLRVVFGLHDADECSSIIVRWPSGVTEEFAGVAADQMLALIENSGTAIPITVHREPSQ